MIIQEKPIQDSYDVSKILQEILLAEHETDRKKEHFWVVGLSTSLRIEYIELVSLGGLNTTPVHPREVFRYAIMKAVNTIILAHNHPSGSLEPSENDSKINARLIAAGEILGIEVLDHIIVTENGSTSIL